MARKKVLNSKLALKDVGNPKAVTMLPDGQNKLILGSIIGNANGVKEVKGPDGITITGYGLKGTFEAIPADEKNDIVGSGVCYLPDAFMQPVIDLLSDEVNDAGEVTREGVAQVKFAFEVGVIKASNPQGYSWQLRPLVEAEANDELAALRSLLPAPVATPAIEGKSK